MKMQRSLFVLSVLFILVCIFGNQNQAWGEENPNGEEILSDPEYLEKICLFHTLPLEKVLASEIQKNGEIYLISSTEIGLYFIERNLNILEQLQAQEFGLVSQRGWMWDLAFNYGWYGKLLRKVGKPEEARPYFAKALKISQEAGGKFTSQNEFLVFLEKLEKSSLKNSRSKGENVGLPFPSSQGGPIEKK